MGSILILLVQAVRGPSPAQDGPYQVDGSCSGRLHQSGATGGLSGQRKLFFSPDYYARYIAAQFSGQVSTPLTAMGKENRANRVKTKAWLLTEAQINILHLPLFIYLFSKLFYQGHKRCILLISLGMKRIRCPLKGWKVDIYIGLHRTTLDCPALHWTSLDCIGPHWTGLDYIGLHWTSLDCIGLHWTALDYIRLHWTALDCTEP